MRQLFRNLVGKEGPQLLPIRPLHHAGVQPVHDDGLKLPFQILVEPIDQFLASVICHETPPQSSIRDQSRKYCANPQPMSPPTIAMPSPSTIAAIKARSVMGGQFRK